MDSAVMFHLFRTVTMEEYELAYDAQLLSGIDSLLSVGYDWRQEQMR